MPNYAKLDLPAFKAKLKNGGYDSLTGAKRAIGKMQEWDEDERDKARVIAAKHFGEDPAAAKKTKKKPAKKVAKRVAKKVAKKTAKKATSKKTAKKTAKKAAKKAAAKPAAGPGPGRGRKKKATKKVAKKAAGKSASKTGKRAAAPKGASSIEQAISQNRDALALHREAIETIKQCEGPGVDISKSLGAALEGVTQIVANLRASVVDPLSDAERRGAELFAKAAPAAVVPTAPTALGGNGQQQHSSPAVPPPPAVQVPVIPPTTSR